MAAAISREGSIGDFEILDIAPDNSYPAGGYDLSGFTGPLGIAFVASFVPTALASLWLYNPVTA